MGGVPADGSVGGDALLQPSLSSRRNSNYVPFEYS